MTSNGVTVLAIKFSVQPIPFSKVRVKNSAIQKGKSSGYRVIYQLQDKVCILLVTLYSKSDETTLTASEIREIIDRFNEPTETSDPGVDRPGEELNQGG